MIASTGRTATSFVAECLNKIPGVIGLHEGHLGNDDGEDILPLINLENFQPLLPSTADVSDEKQESMKVISLKFPDVDFRNSRPQGELGVLTDMVRVARESGVKDIFFYYMPSYGERPLAINLKQSAELRPDWEVFYFREFLGNPSRPSLSSQEKWGEATYRH